MLETKKIPTRAGSRSKNIRYSLVNLKGKKGQVRKSISTPVPFRAAATTRIHLVPNSNYYFQDSKLEKDNEAQIKAKSKLELYKKKIISELPVKCQEAFEEGYQKGYEKAMNDIMRDMKKLKAEV